jgi:tRNA G18 (ribose-2'-O)-methylase SpoU
MSRDTDRVIESRHNPRFKDLKRLDSGKAIRKSGEALLSGRRLIQEAVRLHPERCRALITAPGYETRLEDPPSHLAEYRLTPELLRELDTLGTRHPLLLVDVPPFPRWSPESGLPDGATLFVPFQDPENVGAVVRSGVAFGVGGFVMLAESAHPFHPKAARAASGAVLAAKFLQGPSLADLPEELDLIPLSVEGADIGEFEFPATFGLLPGIEGAGLPPRWRARSVRIPIGPSVESLNAAAAVSIALHVWSGRLR